jgi:hypothetical protein
MTPESPTPGSIAKYVAKHTPKIRKAVRSHAHGGAQTLREADYKGHHIEICTTYTVKVDGKPVTGHIGVSDGGQVHYHAVPNLEFDSAIDLVKKLIDVFPADFKGGKRQRTRSNTKGGGHGGHQG